MSSGSGKLVEVAYAPHPAEAEMIQGLLAEHGIPSMVRRAGGVGVPYFLFAGPCQIVVAEEAAEDARRVLEGATGGD